MSCLNGETLSEILDTLNNDLFPKYTSEIIDESKILYQKLIKQGLSHEEALNASLQGTCVLVFNHAVRLNLLITCLGNSTDDHNDVIDFLKTKVKMNEESDLSSTLTVINGGKE